MWAKRVKAFVDRNKRERPIRYATDVYQFFAGAKEHEPVHDKIYRQRQQWAMYVCSGVGLIMMLFLLRGMYHWVSGSSAVTAVANDTTTHMTMDHLVVPDYSDTQFRYGLPQKVAERLNHHMVLHPDDACVAAIDLGWSYRHIALRDPTDPSYIHHILNPVLMPFGPAYDGQELYYLYPDRERIFPTVMDATVVHAYPRNQLPNHEPIQRLHWGVVDEDHMPHEHIHADPHDHTDEIRDCKRWNAVAVEFEPCFVTRCARRTSIFISEHNHVGALCMQYYLDLFDQVDRCHPKQSGAPPLFSKLGKLVRPT